MFSLAQSARQSQEDHASCRGCGLCLLVCPVWRREHDIDLTPLARAKALQHGAAAADIAASIQSCTLCGACEPVCPEDIGLVAMTLDLLRQLPPSVAIENLRARMEEQAVRPFAPRTSGNAVLLPDQALRARPATLAHAVALLGGVGAAAIADDDGADIALALEAGMAIPTTRLERFLRPLRGMKRSVVVNGLILRYLRQWLPTSSIVSLGVTLSGLAAVRRALRASDLYVIEPRAYHTDYQNLVKHYDALRRETGCTLNLDLQRIAIPATARSLPQRLGLEPAVDTWDDAVQTRWILQGRSIERIVVENIEDADAFEKVSGLPVVHLADLADDGKT